MQLEWSIDELAELMPVEIEFEPAQYATPKPLTPQSRQRYELAKLKQQNEIDQFFDPQNKLAKSPYKSPTPMPIHGKAATPLLGTSPVGLVGSAQVVQPDRGHCYDNNTAGPAVYSSTPARDTLRDSGDGTVPQPIIRSSGVWVPAESPPDPADAADQSPGSRALAADTGLAFARRSGPATSEPYDGDGDGTHLSLADLLLSPVFASVGCVPARFGPSILSRLSSSGLSDAAVQTEVSFPPWENVR